LIDPYFSRVPFSSVLKRLPSLPDDAALDRHLLVEGELAGVLIGHTHFDHAIDVPAIVRRHASTAYGSRSLVNLMALHGMADRAVQVEPYSEYELGPFLVTFVPSLHSKLILGLKVPYDGELTCEQLDALVPSAYRCGDVYGIHIAVAGMTFYHQGSANLIDDAIRHRGVDVFLAGVAGRSVTENYWPRILGRLDPGMVVPNHYDDFFKPLSDPMGFSTNVNLAAVPNEVQEVSGDIAVTALPLGDAT
jgi:L-ascorbate metabolism protein UlaG (beta-lactamase superfamily)